MGSVLGARTRPGFKTLFSAYVASLISSQQNAEEAS